MLLVLAGEKDEPSLARGNLISTSRKPKAHTTNLIGRSLALMIVWASPSRQMSLLERRRECCRA